MTTKTICTLCQEVREHLKYKTDDSNIRQALQLIEDIQYRAHAMEKGLQRSKFDVGLEILQLNVDASAYQDSVLQIVRKRWPSLSIKSSPQNR